MGSDLFKRRTLPVGETSLIGIVGGVDTFPRCASRFVASFAGVATGRGCSCMTSFGGARGRECRLCIRGGFSLFSIRKRMDVRRFRGSNEIRVGRSMLSIMSAVLSCYGGLLGSSRACIRGCCGGGGYGCIRREVCGPRACVFFRGRRSCGRLGGTGGRCRFVRMSTGGVLPRCRVVLIYSNSRTSGSRSGHVRVFGSMCPVVVLGSYGRRVMNVLGPRSGRACGLESRRGLVCQGCEDVASSCQRSVFGTVYSKRFRCCPCLDGTAFYCSGDGSAARRWRVRLA